MTNREKRNAQQYHLYPIATTLVRENPEIRLVFARTLMFVDDLSSH